MRQHRHTGTEKEATVARGIFTTHDRQKQLPTDCCRKVMLTLHLASGEQLILNQILNQYFGH